MYDPVRLSEKIKSIVIENDRLKYYRFRGARWYGGIATGDVVGCNLRCIFCWSNERVRNYPEKVGKFYSPKNAFNKLDHIARDRYHQLRLSGGEPTIGREHLIAMLKIVDKTKYRFILETNGLLIDENYAGMLSEFKNLHVRVSFKGTTPQEFGWLTHAKPDFFNLQLEAIKNLVNANVSCHPSIMASFSKKEGIEKLSLEIKKIGELEIEIEELILYPHILRRLKKMGLFRDTQHPSQNQQLDSQAQSLL